MSVASLYSVSAFSLFICSRVMLDPKGGDDDEAEEAENQICQQEF